jgi:hypothetical protein
MFSNPIEKGRWKLRLERLPVDPANEVPWAWTLMRLHKQASTRPMTHIGSRYRSSAAEGGQRKAKPPEN